MKKRGFFLTTDAFLAIGILVFGLILFLATISHEPYRPQTIFFAHDTIETIGSTKIYEINDLQDQVDSLKKYRKNGNITDFQNTILGQDLEFIYRYEDDDCDHCLRMAHNITRDMLSPLIAEEYSVNVTMRVDEFNEEYEIYSYVHENSLGRKHTMDNSVLVYGNRQVIVEEINDTTIAIGLAKVTVWQ